jgi:hypothetical protein
MRNKREEHAALKMLHEVMVVTHLGTPCDV